MTSEERDLISYLLENNQKSFKTHIDGGNASTLYSSKIVMTSLKRGQVFDALEMPFHIPDRLWEMLEEHRDIFRS